MIVASNLMAMLIQTLSAKLGIATGRNLPEVCRDRFRRKVTIGLWLQAEAIAMATDLAKFLGAALGFKLLFGLALFPAALVTGVAAFVLGIGLCYIVEIFIAHPPLGEVARHAVVPGFKGKEPVLIAVGILGATVMPYVIYLHSAPM